jgi:apolipoprotein N-acyltransferase
VSLKKYQLYLLALLSGILLSFSWFPHGFLPLIFIALIPLLIVEDTVSRSTTLRSRIVFFSGLLAFFTWNTLTTWWLINASWGGAAMAIILNALIMATFFYVAHTIKRRIGKSGNFILICSWIAFEYIHLNWSLSWSWLTLGNAFANATSVIQWYEYTGALGGSLWVLLVNFLLLGFYRDLKARTVKTGKAVLVFSVIALPLLVSFFLGTVRKSGDETGRKLNVVIIQPNVDPYNEKFFLGYQEQLEKMLKLAATAVDSTTDLVVFPETALTEDIWEESFQQSQSIRMLKAFLANYPRLHVVIGANTLKAYGPDEEPSETARKFTQESGYYDIYNTALLVDHSQKVQSYHKSRLVQGVETMPFHFIFKHFESLALDMGGTTGSLGTQPERTLLYSSDSSARIAPVICYESIFGDYVTEYIKKGANLITIITNDGWWGNSPGHRQHLALARLRAVEDRRWIVRSGNTGISCFIDPHGNVIRETAYWVPGTVKGSVYLRSDLTFYAQHGDYIGWLAFGLALLLLLYSWLIRLRILK